MTTLTFHLPFPLHGCPNRVCSGTVVADWPIRDESGVVHAVALKGSFTFAVVQHEGSPWLAAAGWQEHGVGSGAQVTYGGEAHGALSLTRVTAVLPAVIELNPLADAPWVFFKLAQLVNGFIDLHCTQTMTLWTPRATPRDIIDLRISRGGSAGGSGAMLSFDNAKPLTDALAPILQGSTPLYADLAQNYTRPWASTMLDAVREYLAVRQVRAATLAALGFELYLNDALNSCGKSEAAIDATLNKKGTALLGPLVGGALNSERDHGAAVASDWALVLHGRNALLHRQESAFQWQANTVIRRAEVHTLAGSANFLRAALALQRHVRSRLAARGGGVGE